MVRSAWRPTLPVPHCTIRYMIPSATRPALCSARRINAHQYYTLPRPAPRGRTSEGSPDADRPRLALGGGAPARDGVEPFVVGGVVRRVPLPRSRRAHRPLRARRDLDPGE